MIHNAVDIVDELDDEIIVDGNAEDVVGRRRRGVAFEKEDDDGVRRLRLLAACSSLSIV
jgi:hypothetical protein